MTTLIPTASSCHTLQLPPTEKDDRLNLNVRTGSASTLYKSLVFVYGGLTIGLELETLEIKGLVKTFHLKLFNCKSKALEKYLSGEIFHLNLTEREWIRVEIPPDQPKPQPRLFHEMCAIYNSVYVFGGVSLKDFGDSEINGPEDYDKLTPLNDLWEFNLETGKWKLLHDGDGFSKDNSIPSPRFSHKMTCINSLTFLNKKDHYCLLIAGGKDADFNPLYDNFFYDLVDKKYVNKGPFFLSLSEKQGPNSQTDKIITDDDYKLNIDYTKSMILSFLETYNNSHSTRHLKNRTTSPDESLIVYTHSKETKGPDYNPVNPLVSFKIGKDIKEGKQLPLFRNRKSLSRLTLSINDGLTIHPIPSNLRFATGGLFGKNIVIVGFLPNEYDISIYIFNKPTGKWSRLNVFCNHEYGSHRFWGGFVWQSHHKVVLIGNYLTSNTTSHVRYFTIMATVSLPVTNILFSSELANDTSRTLGKDSGIELEQDSLTESTDSFDIEQFSDSDATASSADILKDEELEEIPELIKNSDDVDDDRKDPSAISFSDYVHYAAPKTRITTIRSVFPPTAITLGRNAFDRYANMISDFELVSSSGDRIPVSLMVLRERWGAFFVNILSRSYVQAVQNFEKIQQENMKSDEADPETQSSQDSDENSNKHKSSVSTDGSSLSSHNSEQQNSQPSTQKKDPVGSYPTPLSFTVRPQYAEAPRFRLPFQESVGKDKTSEQSEPKVQTPDIATRVLDKVTSCSPKTDTTAVTKERPPLHSTDSSVDPFHSYPSGKKESNNSSASSLSTNLQRIPSQLPLPEEPVPAVPAVAPSFRGSSRRSSGDLNSRRASLLHTLNVLRSIPIFKSPKGSPFSSPRASLSAQYSAASESQSQALPSLKYGLGKPKGNSQRARSIDASTNSSDDGCLHSPSSESNFSDGKPTSSKAMTSSVITTETTPGPENKTRPPASGKAKTPKNIKEERPRTRLLDFENVDLATFRMEPALIPRIMYFPSSTSTIKAFCEYLYTGQVGNKWLLTPTTVDNLAIGKFCKVPLLFDLVSEALFGIIGRKEAYIIKEGNRLKRRYHRLLKLTNSSDHIEFNFPLDEYQGFMDTVDDGYVDVALLKKSSHIHKFSSISISPVRKNKASVYSGSSLKYDVTEEKDESDSANYSKSDSESVSSSATSETGSESKLLATSSGADSEGLESNLDSNDTDQSNNDSKLSSDDDEDKELGYLNLFDYLTSAADPKAKSVFDKTPGDLKALLNMEKEEENAKQESEDRENLFTLTLDQVVSPDAPLPSDAVIDLIYQSGALVRDMKLMLRASNVREMSKLLNKSKLEIGLKIQQLERMYEEQEAERIRREEEYSKLVDDLNSQSDLKSIDERSSSTGPGKLKHLDSSVSLGGLSGISNLKNSTLEKTRSNTSFKGISSLTPFRNITETRLKRPAVENKEIDKHITSLIKKDEKLKMKRAKEEQKRAKEQKLEIKQLEKAKKLEAKKLEAKKLEAKKLELKKHEGKLNAKDQETLKEALKLSLREDPRIRVPFSRDSRTHLHPAPSRLPEVESVSSIESTASHRKKHYLNLFHLVSAKKENEHPQQTGAGTGTGTSTPNPTRLKSDSPSGSISSQSSKISEQPHSVHKLFGIRKPRP